MNIELPAKVWLDVKDGKPATLKIEVRLRSDSTRDLLYINIDDAVNGPDLVSFVARFVESSHPGYHKVESR